MPGPTPENAPILFRDPDADFILSTPEHLVTTYREIVSTIARLVQLINYYEGFSYRDEDQLTVFDQSVLSLLRHQLQIFVDLRDNLGVTVQFTDQPGDE